MLTDRAASPPAWTLGHRVQACRSGESAIAAEVLMNHAGQVWLLGATMLTYSKQLGYRSVIFNLVFSENVVARRLWEKLGFKELGVIPGAVRKNDGTYQDSVIMFRSLLET